MRSMVIWIVTPCSLGRSTVSSAWRRLCLVFYLVYSYTLKMVVICSSKRLGCLWIYKTLQLRRLCSEQLFSQSRNPPRAHYFITHSFTSVFNATWNCSQSLLNPLKTEFLVTNISESSPYLTGNTLRHRYRAELVNAVYCENHTQHINTLCGQNAEFWYVKAGGAYNYHSAVKD
jgi:hypothetical protein